MTKNRNFRMNALLLVFAMTFGKLGAQIPTGYYNNATDKTGDELKIALHDIIKGHHSVSYSGLLNAFAYTDCKPNGMLWDMYSNFEYSPSSDICGDYENEGDCWNREHTWPQSWFNENTTPRSDLFHVYPTDGFVNAQRSNFPYGEVNYPTYTSGNGSKLGPCATSGYSGTVFEPIDEYKGDIARSYFYMSVRYYSEDTDWGNSGMTEKSVIKGWAMTMLLRWSDEDPVSQKEIDRNNAVYGYQSNRNPFIDHPEYARMIWDPNWTGGDSYDITCVTGLPHGSVSAPATAIEGSTVTLTASPDAGYTLYAWYVCKTDDMSVSVPVDGNNFTMPSFAVTVLASFAQGSASSGNFTKISSAPTDWSGDYILVYEKNASSAYVWTGIDAANCFVEKNIVNASVSGESLITLTIASMTGGYSIKVNGGTNDGKYIYGTAGNNKINFGNAPSANALSYEPEGVSIVSNTSVMRFNTNENRFRYYKSATYSQQRAVQLYKETIAAEPPTHTIHFEPNGGTGSMNDQTVNECEPTELQANVFENEGFVFLGWNTEADGTGEHYDNSTLFIPFEDLTLYAQWSAIYTIRLESVTHGSISASAEWAIESATITLTATPATGYELDHWRVSDAQGNFITVVNNQFVMPASNVTVGATFVEAGQPFVQKYHRVTSTDQLVAGRTYLIVNTTQGKAMGKTQNNNNRSAVDVTVSSGTIAQIGTSVCELLLGGYNGAWTFYDGANNGYLYAAGGGNYLRTQAELTERGKWSISVSNGESTIVSNGESDKNTIRYNPNTSGNPIFSCYASGQQAVSLFIRSEEFDITSNATEANLFPFDKHTVRSGATLSVSGTASCNDPDLLILEEGAQLVHHNEGVQATLKKNIAYFSDNGGWYTLALPFTTYTPENGMTDDNYDLYTYDENADLEWINHKNTPFNLTSGMGYLYAHDPEVALRLAGTLNNGDFTQTLSLNYDSLTCRGFNLIGNPTAHNITFTKSDSVSDGYYYLSNDETWTYMTDNTVPVGRGFLVKANADNQTITLNPQRGKNVESGAYIGLSIGKEKVYVKMNEGVSMPLMDSKVKPSSLYLTRDQQRYVMLVRDLCPTLELNYEVRQKGTHTLRMDALGLDLDYFHLLDKHTGSEIDLLTTPSYTFEAKIGDDASRFLLIFKPIGE